MDLCQAGLFNARHNGGMTAAGRFLRSCRERLSPLTAGIGSTGPRRTPGLRREEVALLAGISVDYLTRIEQGRERTPSPAVVAALADALQLDSGERQHLIALMSLQAQPELCGAAPQRTPVGPATYKLLEQLQPMPAVVLEPWLEVLAWNQAYEQLMGPAGLFGEIEQTSPNLLRFLFASPSARTLYRDWMTVARDHVRGLRAALESCHTQSFIEQLVTALAADSPDFAGLWATQQVGIEHQGVHRLTHPEAGDLQLEYELLTIAGPNRRTVLAYQPADEPTREALQRLTSTRRNHLQLIKDAR